MNFQNKDRRWRNKGAIMLRNSEIISFGAFCVVLLQFLYIIDNLSVIFPFGEKR